MRATRTPVTKLIETAKQTSRHRKTTDFHPVLPVSVIRQPCGTQRGPFTVASAKIWRGSQTSAAQDPITPTDRTGRKSAHPTSLFSHVGRSLLYSSTG